MPRQSHRPKSAFEPVTAERSAVRATRAPVKRGDFEMVLIAASAGGVPALRDFLSELPAKFPVPVAVVLHRTQSQPVRLAQVLSRTCAPRVKTAEEGERLRSGVVYLAKLVTPLRTRRRAP